MITLSNLKGKVFTTGHLIAYGIVDKIVLYGRS